MTFDKKTGDGSQLGNTFLVPQKIIGAFCVQRASKAISLADFHPFGVNF